MKNTLLEDINKELRKHVKDNPNKKKVELFNQGIRIICIKKAENNVTDFFVTESSLTVYVPELAEYKKEFRTKQLAEFIVELCHDLGLPCFLDEDTYYDSKAYYAHVVFPPL